MLTVTIDARDLERARLLMERYPERLRDAMFKANRDSSSVLTRRIKLKVSGDVLKVRTGNLRRGWAQIMPRVDGNSWVGGAGTGVEYDPFHEFGFHGLVQVRAHQRRGDTAFGRKVTPFTASVSAHSRSLDYGGRPHARPALAESKERIQAIHSDQIRQAWEKSK